MSRHAIASTLLLAFIAGLSSGTYAGEFYKCSSGGQVELKPLTMMNGGNPSAESNGPYESAVWYSDATGYATALRESERTGAPLLVFFYTDWCPYCKQFKGVVLPAPAVVQRLRRFVKVRINTERGSPENTLFRDAGGRGIPYVTVRPAGGQMAKITAARTPQEFSAVLDSQLATRN